MIERAQCSARPVRQLYMALALTLPAFAEASWSMPGQGMFAWTFPSGPPTLAAFVQESTDLRSWNDLAPADDSRIHLTVDRAGRDQLRYTLPTSLAPLDFRRLRLAPFRTVPVTTRNEVVAAIASAQPGDAIVLADGVWTAPGSPWELVFNAVGRPGAPVLLTAATPGGAVFSGPTRISISGQHVIVSGLKFDGATNTSGDRGIVEFRQGTTNFARNARLTQSVFLNCNPPSPSTRYHWVTLYGQDNRIDHCHFEGHNHSGVTVVVWVGAVPDRHRIDHNHFAGRMEAPNRENGWETIRVGTSDVSLNSSQTIVERNLFTNCDGEIEIISNKSGDNIYRHNTFVASAGTLTLRHGDRNRVEGNIFLGEGKSGTGGIRVIGEDHVIVNNVITGTRGRGGAAIALVAGIEDSPLSGYVEANRALVAHNTLQPQSGPAIFLAEGLGSSGRTRVPVGVQLTGNILIGAPSGDPVLQSLGGASADWQQNLAHPAAATPTIPGLVPADPLLTPDSESGLPLPAPGSPAIGSVTPAVPGLIEDARGRPRPTPATAGALESAPLPTTLPTFRPLTPADVGPAWWP